ncbi:MAG: ribonuclease Y [Lentisphaeria bacterium]|nr:ribonuclease Y [Lentisphaeria bacterium]MDY0175813.1 ribonuclease Y [Lentisphaeria bacterium]NLZ60665.1 ribonuclease Y [Lentisphaerota bacterium]
MSESIQQLQLAGLCAQAETPFIVGIFLLLAFIIVWMLLQHRAQARQAGKIEDAQKEAEKILRQAQEEAGLLRKNTKLENDVILKEARIRAKEEVISAKEEFENSCTQRKNELQKAEQRLENKEDNLDKKMQQAERRLEELEKRDLQLRQEREKLQQSQNELEAKSRQHIQELERVANLSQEEARDMLLQRLEESLESERGSMIRRFQEEGKQRLLQESQEIMISAMQRYAGDLAYERTTCTIPLPSEDMKGRIIGREGRNIRSIEAATGCNILIDDTPEAVVVSCFDPVRKEVGRITMERLVADGRIHPTRIEDIVNKVSKEIDNEIQKAGQEAVEKMGVTRLRPNIVSLLGSLKYRYSYSQNVLKHSIEVASLMGIIAAQLGLDERKARRAGLLHDIGKAVDHEVEGSHALIGADLLKRAGEDEEVVNAVAAHHEDVEKNSLLAILVNICDTLSASRPGARSETTELYLKRLEQLEKIGSSFEGVENCFAIQAGRELRVIVQPEKINEDAAAILARDMAERIEKEMRYPGMIKVSVIRETRSVEVAK